MSTWLGRGGAEGTEALAKYRWSRSTLILRFFGSRSLGGGVGASDTVGE